MGRNYTIDDTVTVSMYHPETDVEYEIWCKFNYYYDEGDYYQPPVTEFSIVEAEVVSIDDVKVQEDVPDWVDWSDLTL